MITLTVGIPVKTTLGSNATVDYAKLVLSHIELNPVDLSINATARINSTADANQQAINGSLAIQGNVLQLDVPNLDFHRRIVLSGPQVTSVTNIIRNAQNSIEAGLITLGVVAGSQSTGV